METQVAIGTLVARTSELTRLEEHIEWGPSLFRVPGKLPIAVRGEG